MSVLLGNFEVEDRWAVGERGLPRAALPGTRAMTNRMDEFTLTLGGPGDHVVLKTEPDGDHLAHLAAAGLALPSVLVVDDSHPDRTVTQDALASPDLRAALRELAGTELRPHGVSEDEELLARDTGLVLGGAPAHVCKRVNSKIYSRTVATELGLRQPQGWPCRTTAELAAAADRAASVLEAGGRVVVKDAFGVSGKGILVVSDRAALDRVTGSVLRRAERSCSDAVALVVERWVAKAADLNYQFTVDASGAVRFDFVREALTRDGVHLGHRIPARLTATQHAQLRDTAAKLGARLAADGYFGVVGVDAMTDPDGGLYPVVEINARHNMSTYQQRIVDRLVRPPRAALAAWYPVRLRRAMSFAWLTDVLGDLLYARGDGLLVHNFATVNACAYRIDGRHDTVEGRLYGVAVGASAQRAAAIDTEVRTSLAGVVHA